MGNSHHGFSLPRSALWDAWLLFCGVISVDFGCEGFRTVGYRRREYHEMKK